MRAPASEAMFLPSSGHVPRVDVPFEYGDHRVWVTVRINGTEARAIFDTGSDGTALDAGLAADLGLVSQERGKGSTVAGEVQLGKAGPVDLDLGGHLLPAPEVVILPLASELQGLQAILGYDVLQHKLFTLDYPRRRIELGVLPPGERLPFVIEGELRPTARVEVLGERFEGIVDTGSGQGVSLPLAWVEANAPSLLQGKTTHEILGDKLSVDRFILDQIRLGSAVVANVPAAGVSADAGSYADQTRRWADLGNRVLDRFRLGIDGKGRILVFGSVGEG